MNLLTMQHDYLVVSLSSITAPVRVIERTVLDVRVFEGIEAVLEEIEEPISAEVECDVVQVPVALPPPPPVILLPFDITSFALAAGTSPLEIGQVLATPSFTAAYNRAPTTAELSDSDGNPAQNVVSTPTLFASVNTYVKTAAGDSVAWTLTADDGTGADTAQVTRSWLPLVFTGVLAGPGPYTEAEIEGLAQQVLQSSAAKSTTLSPTFQYIVHAYPASYGPKTPANFTIGNFGSGDMSEIQTSLSITNAHGVTTTYRVARSDNLLNAPSGIAFGVT